MNISEFKEIFHNRPLTGYHSEFPDAPFMVVNTMKKEIHDFYSQEDMQAYKDSLSWDEFQQLWILVKKERKN